MKNHSVLKKISILILGTSLSLAELTFDINWVPYVSYYISSVDISSGKSEVPIFSAVLDPGDNEYEISIEFSIYINSEELDVDDYLIRLNTPFPFTITDKIVMSNMDLDANTNSITNINGQMVDIGSMEFEAMDLANVGDMLTSLLLSGQLPNGTYTFSMIVTPVGGEPLGEPHIITITNQDLLQIISPGGALADTTYNEIYTSYPVFQWSSDACNIPGGCDYFIRVAEYRSDEHSSVEQAIEGVTILPLDQTLGFTLVGSEVTTFQYPTNGGDLIPGKTYAWQIRKDMPTTSGTEQLLSDIVVFKVKDFSSSGNGSTKIGDNSPAGMLLRSLIGNDLADRMFGDGGELAGMNTNGKITLNGEMVDISVIQSLVSSGVPSSDENGNNTFRPMEIISVQVAN
ncbi:MAG: hypothetical protein ACJZ12_03850 [Candidatus Neomarinimicrobiota bacterium]